MIVRTEGKILMVGEIEVTLDYTIRKMIEFSQYIIVLVGDKKILSNNVMAFDKQGKLLWKINDIFGSQNATGNVDIGVSKQGYLKVFSDLDILYLIDVENRSVID